MAYQSVEARFSVRFDDPEDARKFVAAMKTASDLLSPVEKAFEVDMTKEDYEALGNRLESSKGGDTVELSFGYEFDVSVSAGCSGSREEPGSPACVEDYVYMEDIENYLKEAIKSCGVNATGLEIECEEFFTDDEEEILERECERDY